MFPEAPLALRLSGHLLLGVVRIYSKQVDYLFRDCALVTTWLSKSFVSTQVDLPDDARQAPVESVTLPQALNLDDFQLDDDTQEGYPIFLFFSLSIEACSVSKIPSLALVLILFYYLLVINSEYDNHLRSQEDITLTGTFVLLLLILGVRIIRGVYDVDVDYADQIPTGVDPYVAITFDDVSFLLAFL